MRQVIDPQLRFGEQDISAIKLDPRSRDDIPRILRGLQHIYTTPEVRERVFAILAEVLPQRADDECTVSADTGRPGMAFGHSAGRRAGLRGRRGRGPGGGDGGAAPRERGIDASRAP